ncbi:ABC transporter ATP-binding protein [Candidatus Cardinium hertigii]|nr:ATP-binding cassette domain-containing protein [Candidatus Cardinium hertigii]
MRNTFTEKKAVDNVSFKINCGEIVGYIGPNGAGKSTTIKMLIGVLKPSLGSVYVAGRDPFVYRQDNAMQIGVLFGQRTQLWWDLPLIDTLNLHCHMYRLSKETYLYQVEWLSEVLELQNIIKVPIRQLSFGQRMRCELAVTLLHKPSILYLDEPTIGMDVIVKSSIRDYLLKINKHDNITILLTSHDLVEIENICNRIMVINDGKLLFDGTINKLREEYMPNILVTLKYEGTIENSMMHRLNNYTEVAQRHITFNINKQKEGLSIISDLYRYCNIIDLQITESPIEDIIKELYKRT